MSTRPKIETGTYRGVPYAITVKRRRSFEEGVTWNLTVSPEGEDLPTEVEGIAPSIRRGFRMARSRAGVLIQVHLREQLEKARKENPAWA